MLRLPRLGLEAPILAGTDDKTLNRGIGHIEGAALPGAPGNSGLAGHRDGFFRVLKDIAVGDVLEVETLDGRRSYIVDRASIVHPDDVSVLEPTPSEAVTLVTCYPFYFVGSAPNRFIVRATQGGSLWGEQCGGSPALWWRPSLVWQRAPSRKRRRRAQR